MAESHFYETKADEFLKLKGYETLERNFRSRFGEIDIIARDREFISFVEVKARSSRSLFSPREAVDKRKRYKISKTALFYAKNDLDKFFRFDVVEIVQGESWRQYILIKNAFNLYE